MPAGPGRHSPPLVKPEAARPPSRWPRPPRSPRPSAKAPQIPATPPGVRQDRYRDRQLAPDHGGAVWAAGPLRSRAAAIHFAGGSGGHHQTSSTAKAIGGDIAGSERRIQRALSVRSDGRDRRTIPILTVMCKMDGPRRPRREPTVPRRSDPCELLPKSEGFSTLNPRVFRTLRRLRSSRDVRPGRSRSPPRTSASFRFPLSTACAPQP